MSSMASVEMLTQELCFSSNENADLQVWASPKLWLHLDDVEILLGRNDWTEQTVHACQGWSSVSPVNALMTVKCIIYCALKNKHNSLVCIHLVYSCRFARVSWAWKFLWGVFKSSQNLHGFYIGVVVSSPYILIPKRQNVLVCCMKWLNWQSQLWSRLQPYSWFVLKQVQHLVLHSSPLLSKYGHFQLKTCPNMVTFKTSRLQNCHAQISQRHPDFLLCSCQIILATRGCCFTKTVNLSSNKLLAQTT